MEFEFVKRYLIISVYLGLAMSTLLVFRQALNFDFVNYDDEEYVYGNPHVLNGLTGDGFIWAFTKSGFGYWQPLTWLSLMLDCQLAGPDPGWFHLVNIFLHLANTLLLFAVLKRMTGSLWPSVFVASAFALHPMHVESVVWIAERKDVLSTLFWMLTLTVYTDYVKRPSAARYLAALTFFTMGLMAKPMLVTLPFVLLLLDYWPLSRFEPFRSKKMSVRQSFQVVPKHDSYATFYRMIIEKIPFFLLSALYSIIAYLTQKAGGGLVGVTVHSWKAKVFHSFFSYTAYMSKLFWPANLAVYYPSDALATIAPWRFVLYALVVIGLTFLVFYFGCRRKYLAVGWFWFVGTLVPVIGLIEFTGSAYGDRFTYIPYIGLFIMIAWGLPELLSKWPQRKMVLGMAAAMMLTGLGLCAHRQVGYWKNSITLFSHAIEVTQGNALAYNNIGIAYSKAGRLQEAMDSLKEAIRIRPDYADAQYNLGTIYGDLGRLQEAMEAYQRTLQINPDYADAYNNLGVIYGKLGRYPEAINTLKHAIKINPELTMAYNNIGISYGDLGCRQEAIDYARRACELTDYRNASFLATLAQAYWSAGQFPEVAETAEAALKINPNLAGAHRVLAKVLSSQGFDKKAEVHLRRSLELEPNNIDH